MNNILVLVQQLNKLILALHENLTVGDDVKFAQKSKCRLFVALF